MNESLLRGVRGRWTDLCYVLFEENLVSSISLIQKNIDFPLLKKSFEDFLYFKWRLFNY